MLKKFKYFLFLFVVSLHANIEDVFYGVDQKIVLSTKQLIFEDYPGAFNPSIIKKDSGFLLIFRYCPDPANQSWISSVAIVELDNSLAPLGKPKILNTRPKRSKTPSQAEDARLFKFQDKLYLIYNDNIDEICFDHIKRRDIFIAELIFEDGQYRLASPLKLTHPDRYPHQLQQKNWAPFEAQEKLLLSYSLNPHEVLNADLQSGICFPYYKTAPPIQWIYGSMKGSSSAELIDGEYLAFFHSAAKTKSPVSYDWRLWHYFMGAYTFSATPPFELTKMSEKPILSEHFYTASFGEKRVIFPGGFAVDDRYIYVAYGKDDREIWIAILDKDVLMKSLKKLNEYN
jgi:predicted GH43/DUF377 family glycosyl hydrolase